MESKLIKTEADHARALAHIESHFDAKPGTPEGDALDLWVTLVELYEEQTFPIPAPDPLTPPLSDSPETWFNPTHSNRIEGTT
jgi:HTH-type transcriptional regulator/antitoxin HigA